MTVTDDLVLVETLLAEWAEAEARPDSQVSAERGDWIARRVAENCKVLEAADAGMRAALGGAAAETSADRGRQVVAVLSALLPEVTPNLPAPGLSSLDMIRSALACTTVRTRRVELAARWWSEPLLPMVGFREDGTPIGLVPGGSRYRLFDPATGTSTGINADSAAAVAASAIVLYRSLPEDMRTLRQLTAFSLRGAKRDLALLVAAGLTAAVIALCVPIAAGTFVPSLLVPGGRHEVLWLSVLLGVTTVSFALFQIVRNAAGMRLQGRFQTVLEPAVWNRLLSLDASFFGSYSTGDLVQRTNAIAQIRQSLSGSVVNAVMGAFFSVASLGVIIAVEPALGFIAFVAAVALVALLVCLARRQQVYEAEVYRLFGEVYGHLYGVLLSIDKVQVAGREVQAFSRWAGFFAKQKSADAVTLRYQAAVSAVMAGAQPLMLLAVLGGIALFNLHSTAGHLVVVGVAVSQVVIVLGQLSQVATAAFSAQPILERLRPVLDAPPERGTGARDPGPLQGRVVLEDVSFTYPGAVEAALSHVSIEAEPGKMTAIVGASGAGKSTIIRLLLGYEVAEAGRVAFDDHDLNDVDPRLVRRQLGVVMQHSKLVRGSLLANLTSGAPDATATDAWEAARLAGVDDLIRNLPLGMDTPVGEDNQTFSGGQLQRLQLARSLVKRPPVLLLDEATSALDNTTQQAVADRLAGLDTTRIVIAHRLSTIRRADRIYVLDGGRVVETGTYESLVQSGQIFARLVQRQELE